MDETSNRKRQFVRIALLLVVLPFRLIASYVSTWLTLSGAAPEGLVSSNTAFQVLPVFMPLWQYCGTASPGAVSLNRLWWNVNPPKVVYDGDTTTKYATPALALAPADHPHRRNLGGPAASLQPIALPRAVPR